MNTENNNDVKKNVATGVSTAAGATAGVIIGSVYNPLTADAEEIQKPEIPGNQNHEPQHGHEQNPPVTEPGKETPVTGPDEVEVVGYDRIDTQDGGQIDLAVVNYNGNEVGIIDLNLDGEADVMVCDVNNDGVIDENEVIDIHGQGLAMEPLQDAAGFSPLYAQNDLPDYVNDAEVDTYMA